MEKEMELLDGPVEVSSDDDEIQEWPASKPLNSSPLLKTILSHTQTPPESQRKENSHGVRQVGDTLNVASQVVKIQQQIDDLKAIIAKQGQFNDDVLEMLQQAMSGKDGSPMVGSNSSYIIWSKNKGTTTTEPLNKPDTTGLRTYKRCKTRTKNNRNDDPDYDPKLNHITNSDDGSFKFSRGKGKKKVSFKTAMPKSGPRGRRNLFPASMSSRGCHEPKISYVTNTTVKIARARNLQ
ncbi:uncharacterized protein LOC110265426 [Arachis ipaensis]|uniref:uncharacterized protein LOC110265426 n=1 Tax=Arachis ipaensis TaxID=130454 RepID=UPI000A2B722C|nr:uncharacterized protein LOC110265426 [Arachis ipaensis]